MRKIIIILIIVLSIIVGGFGAFWYLNQSKTDIEEVLPEGAILHVKFSNIEEAMEKIAKTQLWDIFTNINYEKLISSFFATDAQKNNLLEAVRSFKDFKNNEFFQAFFSREVAITAYPFELPKNVFLTGVQDILQPALSSFYVSIRLSPKAQALKMLSKWVANSSGGEIDHQSKSYKDISYDVFTPKGSPYSLVAVKHGDVLVVALNEYPIRKSIDIVLTSRLSLKDDSVYKKAQEHMFADQMSSGYVNIDLLLQKGEKVFQDFVKNSISSTDNTLDPKKIFAPYQGFKQFIFSSKWDSLIQKKLILLYDSKLLSPEMAQNFDSCQGQKTNAINLVPQESIGYYWSGCLNLDYYWEQFKKETIDSTSEDEKLTPEEKLIAFENTLGLSVEKDILPAFANEIGAFLVDIQGGGIFPIPQFAIFIEIENKEKVESLLTKALSKSFFVLQNEEFDGKTIKYFQSPIGQILEPGYVLSNKYLIISTKRDILKKALASQKDPTLSLKSNEAFKEVDSEFSDKNVGVAFFEFNKIMGKLGILVEAGNNIITAKTEQQKAFQSGSKLRLNTTLEEIKDVEGEIKASTDKAKKLENEVRQLNSQAVDSTEKADELKKVKDKLLSLEAELADLNNQKTELEGIIAQYEEPLMDTEGRRLILDEVIYPVIKGLGGIRSFSSVTKSSPGIFETNIFIQFTQ